MPADPAPATPATQILARMESVGFYHKDIADLLHTDRTLVTHWRNGTRQLPVDQLARIGVELVSRWPERRLLWAELLLGGLAALFGCRIVAADPHPPDPVARVVGLDDERRRRLRDAQSLLAELDREAA